MNLAHFSLGICLFNVLWFYWLSLLSFISLIHLSLYALVNRLINLTLSLYLLCCFCLSLFLRCILYMFIDLFFEHYCLWFLLLSRDSFVSLTHCIKLYSYRLINTCMYAYWDNDTQSLQHKTFCTPDLEVPMIRWAVDEGKIRLISAYRPCQETPSATIVHMH